MAYNFLIFTVISLTDLWYKSSETLKFLDSALWIGIMFEINGSKIPRVIPRMTEAVDKL